MDNNLRTIRMECKNCKAVLDIPAFGGKKFDVSDLPLLEATDLLGSTQAEHGRQVTEFNITWVICPTCNRSYSYTPYDVFIEIPPDLVKDLRAAA